MERLTSVRCNGIKTGYWSPAKKDELIQRLGLYEDTGLEPEAISNMAKFIADLMDDQNVEVAGTWKS